MDFLALTKGQNMMLRPIVEPIANVLGWIMNMLFELTSSMGIFNIGLCIILFTFVTKLLMFPLTIKQQTGSKLMSVLNPEIKAIQKKYKDKKDQESLAKQQTEMQAVYNKYGYSPTAGCLPMLIQFPIIFALYPIIYNIPAYVSSVKDVFMNVVNPLMQQPGYTDTLNEFAEAVKMLGTNDFTIADKVVDLLYKFTPDNWIALQQAFPSIGDVIAENAAVVARMNAFFGINLSVAPGWTPNVAWLIPILAGLTQWISTKLMTVNQDSSAADSDNPMAQSMKSMNVMMPLMSAFFCVTFPSGIGIYWIASSVFQILQQLIVNSYMNKMDIDQLIAHNVEKMNKKRAKKGQKPTLMSQVANSASLKAMQEKEAAEEEKRKKLLENQGNKVKESTEYYNKDAKPGSLASKASMVQKYNEKNTKK